MNGQTHQSDPRVLNQRTLAGDHRRMAELLYPGLSVLDVGCGTGSITRGIAHAVSPGGRVVGVDRDASLLDHAVRLNADVPNLRFEYAEAETLPFRGEFDIVNAARTLQWVADPGRAIARMRDAAHPGGLVVVLDYNHFANQWQPEPPAQFRNFYDAFLRWRGLHGWDNELGDHIPYLLEGAGLSDIESRVEDEEAIRGAADFEDRTGLWTQVMETLGSEIVLSGLLRQTQLAEATNVYREWAASDLMIQRLVLRAVTGRVL